MVRRTPIAPAAWRCGLACGVIILVVAVGAGFSPGVAGAAAAARPPATQNAATTVCAGTVGDPGFLNDQAFDNVVITGVCQVSAGPVLVRGNLTVVATADPAKTPTALEATFALNDRAGDGSLSGITVDGNIYVQRGAVLMLGCEPVYSPCTDDPTLAMAARVGGEIVANGALGVSVHASTIGKGIVVSGGGGGRSCTPIGVFKSLREPDFTALRDDIIGGSLTVTSLATCRLSVLSNRIHGSVNDRSNLLADSISGTVGQNLVGGNLNCVDNRPSVPFGNSGALPNIVDDAATGECSFTTRSPDPDLGGGGSEPISISSRLSYWLADGDGSVDAYSQAHSYGGGRSTLVAITPKPDGGGYWLASADGGVEARGDAASLGSMSGKPLAAPIVGMATSADGRGYWLVGADGGVFAFGDARFHGSLGAVRLAKPIVGMTPTPDGRGYWLVGAGGGVFAFGDARFDGSESGTHLDRPIVGITATPSGRGYWLVGADGGVFAFGNARFYGSLTGTATSPVVSLLASPGGVGYWLVASSGDVTSFGELAKLVSTSAPPSRSSVAAAALLP